MVETFCTFVSNRTYKLKLKLIRNLFAQMIIHYIVKIWSYML